MTTATIETETRPLAALKVRDGGNVRATLDGVDALAESIRLVGVLVPVAIEPDGTIVAGHRRYAAAVKAGLSEIPVRVISDVEAAAGTAGAASTAFAALENIAREQLSPDEEATAIERMLDAGYTPDGAAQILAMPLARVTRRAQLLKLPPELRAHYRAGGTGPLSILPLLVTIAEAQPWLAKAIAKFDLRDLAGNHASQQLDDVVTYCHGQIQSWDRKSVPKGLPKPPAGFVWLDRRSNIRSSVFSAGAKIPAELKARLDKAAGNYYSRVEFDEADWDAARAAGVLLSLPIEPSELYEYESWGDDEEGVEVITDATWLIDRLPVMLDRIEAKQKANAGRASSPAKASKAKAGAAAAPAKTDREYEQEAQRDHDREIAARARGANLELGAALMTRLANVELTVDVARLFAEALLGDRPKTMRSYQTADPTIVGLAAGGMRYVIADWQKENTPTLKSGKPGRTVVTYLERDEAVKRTWAWFDGAKEPGEILGRALVILAAARWTCERCVPQSQRRYSDSWRAKTGSDAADKALEAIATPLLPESVKQLAKAISGFDAKKAGAKLKASVK